MEINISNMKKYLLLGFVTFLIGILGFSRTFENEDASATLNQFVGTWNPDKLGWHGPIVISYSDGKLHLKMRTEDGEMEFEDVRVCGKEISWSYCDEVKHAVWYLGEWRETKRTEILLDVDGIYGSSGVPTTVFQRGVMATSMRRCWEYHGTLVGEVLQVGYGSKSDYYSSSDEKLFDKVIRNDAALCYRK